MMMTMMRTRKKKRKVIMIMMIIVIWLVVSTPLKNISQNMSKWESSPGRGENKKLFELPASSDGGEKRLASNKSPSIESQLTGNQLPSKGSSQL